MVVTVRSLGLTGIRGYEVSVECFLSGGLPGFDVVGLPDAAVKESRERVRAAVMVTAAGCTPMRWAQWATRGGSVSFACCRHASVCAADGSGWAARKACLAASLDNPYISYCS